MKDFLVYVIDVKESFLLIIRVLNSRLVFNPMKGTNHYIFNR